MIDRERESGGSENKLLLETTYTDQKHTQKKPYTINNHTHTYTQSLLIHSLLTAIEVTIQTHNYKKVHKNTCTYKAFIHIVCEHTRVYCTTQLGIKRQTVIYIHTVQPTVHVHI